MIDDNGTTAELVQGTTVCSLEELAEACQVETSWVLELAEYGVIESVAVAPPGWTFTTTTIVQVAKAKRLERDLALNLPGIALAFELLAQIEELRVELRSKANPHEIEAGS